MSAVENTVGMCLLKIMLYCSPCNLVLGLWAQRADMECVLQWSIIQSPWLTIPRCCIPCLCSDCPAG
jgi:hypothetical protein